MLNFTKLIWLTFCCISTLLIFVETIVVSRSTRDLFSNRIRENCTNDDEYCTMRKATCLDGNCCTCKCKSKYSTFHSPGVNYYHSDGKASYKFDAKESCAWNHYAHEGCRFIEKHPSNLSTRFLPLINLNRNGTLHLKTALDGIYKCNQYRLFLKRPFEYEWMEFDGDHLFKTIWNKIADVQLILEWSTQGPMYGGLLLKLNFSCELSEFDNKHAEPCVILKIKGSYDTETNASMVPTDTPKTETIPKPNVVNTIAAVHTISAVNTIAAQTTPRTLVLIKHTEPVRKKTSTRKTMNRTTRTTTQTPGNAVSNKNTTTKDERGDTFWVLVYVFMAFAIFEVLCVALFLLCRRRKRKARNENAKDKENSPTQRPTNYENHGMSVPPESPNRVNAFPENIQLYENNEYMLPRYHPVRRMGTFTKEGDLAVIENGVIVNQELSETGSAGNPNVFKSGSIIVLPKDCVIVHSSGSKKSGSKKSVSRKSGSQKSGSRNAGSMISGSRNSRRSERQQVEIVAMQDEAIKDDGEEHNSDNNSLYSWESFTSYERTSTDEDYVSGGYRTFWEEDSLYEEPDKVFGTRDEKRPPLPPKNFGLRRLFSLKETAITVKEDVREGEKVEDNTEDKDDDDKDDYEHIYETAENVCSEKDYASSYYENVYDLPEDAIADSKEKLNRASLQHVFDEGSSEDEVRKSSLNLGCEFVNNSKSSKDGTVMLKPKRQSTLYLCDTLDTSKRGTSVC